MDNLLIAITPAVIVGILGALGPLLMRNWQGWLIACLALPPTVFNIWIATDGVRHHHGQWPLGIMCVGWTSLPIIGLLFVVLLISGRGRGIRQLDRGKVKS